MDVKHQKSGLPHLLWYHSTSHLGQWHTTVGCFSHGRTSRHILPNQLVSQDLSGPRGSTITKLRKVHIVTFATTEETNITLSGNN